MTHTRHLAACFAFAIAFFLAPAPEASAQTSVIEPQFVVVTRPDSNPAQLRCFAGQIWYPIEFLKQGQVLRADAVRDDWYRVGYPAGMPAAVRIGEARYDSTSHSVTLTNASALQARHLGRPTSVECYKEIFDPHLPAGSVLTVVDEMRENGELTGYFVLPPEGAKGWVNRRHVRDATPEEIDAHHAIELPETPAHTPEPVQTTDPVVDDSTIQDEETTEQPVPAQTPVELTPIDDDSDLEHAPAIEDPEPTTEAETAPESIVDPAPETGTDDRTQAEAEPALTPAQKREALYAKLAELDASYEAITDQQTEGAEIAPLREEYAALRDEAGATTDDPALVRMAAYADARIALLSLRAEVQLVQAKLAELEEQADASQLAIQSTRENIIRARGYAMVGVLTRSSLYTGGELPLRYRLQSGPSASARTIAYIEAKEGTDLAPLLGKDVGIIVAQDGVKRTGPVPILRADLVEEVDLDSAVSNR